MVTVDVRLVAKLLAPNFFYFAVLALAPSAFAVLTGTDGAFVFALTALISVCIGIALKKYGQKAKAQGSLRVMFLFTATLWAGCTVLSAIPLYLGVEQLHFMGALFESASALSTTGATAISGLEKLPHSILLWRAMLQYIGGIGFIFLAIIILPNITGALNLFKTESSSFDGQTKFTPHIKTMAISVLVWYVLLLLLCTFLFIYGGYDWFLALTTAMCTVSTGGMMILDESMNDASPYIHYIAIIFMFLSSCPFLLILGSISGRNLAFFKDQQVRGFILLNLIVATLTALSLMANNGYSSEKAIRVALFNVVSITSSTGFALEDFTSWNHFASILFLFILGIGGCSGSTSGGIKIFRLQIFFEMFRVQLNKIIHPHAVMIPRYNHKALDGTALNLIITFLVSYLLILALSSCIACLLGLNLADAITASLSCLSNIGPAMGPELNPAHNFSRLSDGLHLLFSIVMIFGRLEILPVMLCFTRMFWKN